MGEEVIDRLAAEGLQVIAKLHDRSYDTRDRASGGVDWAARLARYDAHPRVRVVREGDASPFLVASDAMVSDHSSVAFEFAILDRPLVVIDSPELIRHARVNLAKVAQLRSCADVVRDAPAVAAAVVHALRAPARLSKNRRQIASDLFYKPGTASSRAASIIYRMVELPDAIGAHSMVESDPARPLAAVG
jgi:CDP-glycerol glycerophosphotransferase (TagB/SpsB family)